MFKKARNGLQNHSGLSMIDGEKLINEKYIYNNILTHMQLQIHRDRDREFKPQIIKISNRHLIHGGQSDFCVLSRGIIADYPKGNAKTVGSQFCWQLHI